LLNVTVCGVAVAAKISATEVVVAEVCGAVGAYRVLGASEGLLMLMLPLALIGA
jgi:hypothetical protein